MNLEGFCPKPTSIAVVTPQPSASNSTAAIPTNASNSQTCGTAAGPEIDVTLPDRQLRVVPSNIQTGVISAIPRSGATGGIAEALALEKKGVDDCFAKMRKLKDASNANQSMMSVPSGNPRAFPVTLQPLLQSCPFLFSLPLHQLQAARNFNTGFTFFTNSPYPSFSPTPNFLCSPPSQPHFLSNPLAFQSSSTHNHVRGNIHQEFISANSAELSLGPLAAALGGEVEHDPENDPAPLSPLSLGSAGTGSRCNSFSNPEHFNHEQPAVNANFSTRESQVAAAITSSFHQPVPVVPSSAVTAASQLVNSSNTSIATPIRSESAVGNWMQNALSLDSLGSNIAAAQAGCSVASWYSLARCCDMGTSFCTILSES